MDLAPNKQIPLQIDKIRVMWGKKYPYDYISMSCFKIKSDFLPTWVLCSKSLECCIRTGLKYLCLPVHLHKEIGTPPRHFHHWLLLQMPNYCFWSQTKCLTPESQKIQNLGDWRKNTWVIWHPVYSCVWKINVYFQSVQYSYSPETATSWKTVCTTVSLWEDSATESSLGFFPPNPTGATSDLRNKHLLKCAWSPNFPALQTGSGPFCPA